MKEESKPVKEKTINEILAEFEKVGLLVEKLGVLNDILKRLDEIKDYLINKDNAAHLETYIPLKDVSKIIHISIRKIHSLRKNGELICRNVGRKIYIERGEIDRFMKEHQVEIKNKQ